MSLEVMEVMVAYTNTENCMITAIKKIDAIFGKDYAKDHPELVAAFMKTWVTLVTVQTKENLVIYN